MSPWLLTGLWMRWRRVRRDRVLAEAQRMQEEEQTAARRRVLDGIRAAGPAAGVPRRRPANGRR